MRFRSLYSRIAFTFAILILLFGGLCGGLDWYAAKNHQQEIIQRLSRGLAEHIATSWPLLSQTNQLNESSIKELFHWMMVVNPSIEVYLLDTNGLILSHQAPPGRALLKQVGIKPIKDFLAGAALPLKGDNPRNPSKKEIFSATAMQNNGKVMGYLYIVLTGDDYQRLASDVWQDHVFQTAIWIGLGGLALTLFAGLGLFAVITRRLDALSSTVADFEQSNFTDGLQVHPKIISSPDEIGRLANSFEHMAQRITTQMQHIKSQDELRREMVANVSHDLRTPLTAMQGYLETLLRKSNTLSSEEQHRYLEVAVRQSQRVSHLAHQLFELAKLEYEEIKPHFEPFFLQELMQDIVQKFELNAQNREIQILASFAQNIPMVTADIGMIERVLTNLMDNALRHTNKGGNITLALELSENNTSVIIKVSDTGTGIPEAHLASLFERHSPLRQSTGKAHDGGGLGLLISKRILQLHDSAIKAMNTNKGAMFMFNLPIIPNSK
jgi:signal transduction histidine kinase